MWNGTGETSYKSASLLLMDVATGTEEHIRSRDTVSAAYLHDKDISAVYHSVLG